MWRICAVFLNLFLVLSAILCAQVSSIHSAKAQSATPTATPQGLSKEQIKEILDNSLVKDFNGDGAIRFLAFGDSITRGVGDFTDVGEEVSTLTSPSGEAGYPLRVEHLLKVAVANHGSPGEKLIGYGVYRFASEIPNAGADVVLISGGSNDAFIGTTQWEYSHGLQTMINIARASGSEVVLIGTPPSCCEHSGTSPYTNMYNRAMVTLSGINDVSYVNTYKAFVNTGGGPDECELLNLPDGLHPNTVGYDVLGEAVTAAILRLDIFRPDGPSKMEQVLGLTAGSIKLVPDAS